MERERNYAVRADKLRGRLAELLKKEDVALLEEYDALVALFQAQESRHHREMYEAVSGLLRRRPLPKRTVKTYVYLMANQAGEVKIGLSTNPERRLRTLSTANAHPLRLLHFVVGGRSLERALHSKFKQYHIRNEWYSSCSDIEDEFVKLSGAQGVASNGVDGKTTV